MNLNCRQGVFLVCNRLSAKALACQRGLARRDRRTGFTRHVFPVRFDFPNGSDTIGDFLASLAVAPVSEV